MKSRAIIPLAIGLAIGVFAIKYFVNVVQKAKGAAAADLVQVVCTNADIAPTVEIKETMLEVKTLPKALTPKLCFSDKKELVGRVASMPIAAGMPLVPNLLAPKGTPPGLSVLIKEGYRAVAVQVDEFAGVAGWIKPGSHVDVVAVITGRNGAQNESISKVILQNIEVLAVGQDSGSKSDTGAALAKSVTLAVLPAEVPKLHLAATKGKIRLAMRNQSEQPGDAKFGTTTDNDLLGLPAISRGGSDGEKESGFLASLMGKLPKPDPKATDKEAMARRMFRPTAVQQPQTPPEKEWVVELMSGSQVQEVRFEGEGSSQRRVSGKEKNRPQRSPAGAVGFVAPVPAATDTQ